MSRLMLAVLCCIPILATAESLGTARPAGYLFVTEPPFNVNNSGLVDVTASLQAALTYAQAQFLVAYFPLGTYRISAPLQVQINFTWSVDANNTYPNRFQPNVLQGARGRPRIVLTRGTFPSGAGGPAQVMLNFGNSDINFNQLLRGTTGAGAGQRRRVCIVFHRRAGVRRA